MSSASAMALFCLEMLPEERRFSAETIFWFGVVESGNKHGHFILPFPANFLRPMRLLTLNLLVLQNFY
jgi:hypothetical protein